ncbi:CAP domain-containing protein [Ruegeria sp. AD91A]|uniref:CAP domain-containing protein n=1 Tax=Ruegeria sp. AD91A TaxID=2293862 RepID=UPI000E46FFC1|nr:CAP domain-containing protein [Ruegeria sp. AD91A]AXT27349.1 CAP domain-containing protein [Ruegeria sp. AD91A]
MSTASTFEREMLGLINQERTSRGLNPLQLETQLNDSSEDHSTWMLNTDTFSHTGSGGSSATQRMQGAGFDLEGSWRTGENIAWQSERGAPGISDDVAQLHQNLMSSPGHRANILNPDFKYIGIGVETGDMQGFDAVMVTQNFAATDAAVMLDNGNTNTPPVPPTTPDEVAVPEEPEVETPDTDVTETEEPGTETPGTEEPTPETPDIDVTETEEPEPETPDTDVTETEKPGTETPGTEEPTPEAPDTDVTETEEPEPETPDTDVTETEEPEPEMPDTEVVDGGEPEAFCFDVQAFLDEIANFLENLQAQFDEFDWDDDMNGDTDVAGTDDVDMMPTADATSETESEPAGTETADVDDCDIIMVNFFNFDCMMDAA